MFMMMMIMMIIMMMIILIEVVECLSCDCSINDTHEAARKGGEPPHFLVELHAFSCQDPQKCTFYISIGRIA
jgi:hypothetical protein